MALTKVSGGILDPGIDVAGIVTARGFDGPFTGGSGSNITAGIITCTELDLNGSGNISGNLVIEGNLTANGDFTTLNTTLREVEILRVESNSSAVAGIITQSGSGDILNLYDGSTEIFSVEDGGDIISKGQFLKIENAGSPEIQLTDTSASDSLCFFRNSSGNLRLGADNNNVRTGTSLMFLVDGGEAMRIKGDDAGSSKVGIGTDDPEFKLDVAGNTRIFRTSAGGALTMQTSVDDATDMHLNFKKARGGTGTLSVVQDGDDLATINAQGYSAAAGDFKTAARIHFEVDGEPDSSGDATDMPGRILFETTLNGTANPQERLRITSGGVVGIGTTDPTGAQKLNVYADSTGTGGILQITQDGTGDAAIDFQLKGTREYSLGIDNSDDDKFKLSSTAGLDSNAILVATTDGKVGIGSDEPADQLDVAGNPIFGTKSTADAQVQIGRRYSGNRNAYIDMIGDDNFYDYGLRIIRKNTGQNAESQIDHRGTGDFSISANEEAAIRFTTQGGEKLRIASDGNVGINSISPQTRLDVVESYANRTWTPSTSLVSLFERNGICKIGLVAAADSYCQIDFGDPNDDNVGFIRYHHADNSMSFRTNTDTNFTITSDGKSIFSGEIETAQDYPNFRPTLDLNFAAEKKLDSRITYERTGPASFVNEFGKVVLVGDNAPRFDHNPTTRESKGLLIEESRTNYVRVSTNLESEWSAGTGSFAVDNSITNPDGSVGAYYHTGSELYHQNIDLSGASTNTVIVSLWVKERSGQSGNLDIEIYQQITGSVVNLGGFSFNPATEAISLTSNYSNGTVEEYPNGWYRVSAKLTTASGNFTSSTRYDMQNAEHYVWGMQLEVGEVLTSFIPTHGSTATRGDDIVRIMDDDFTDIFGTEFENFSVVADFDNSNSADAVSASILEWWGESGAYTDRIQIFKDNSSPYHIETRAFGGNSAIFSNGNLSASSKAASNRFATSWSVDYSTSSAANRRWAFSFSGEDVDVINDNTGTTTPTLTRFGIGCSPTRLDFTRGTLLFKRLMVYNQTLSDNQLRTLSA